MKITLSIPKEHLELLYGWAALPIDMPADAIVNDVVKQIIQTVEEKVKKKNIFEELDGEQFKKWSKMDRNV